MIYYAKNESGNVSTITENMYDRLKQNDDYEVWEENQNTSTNFTVKECQELAKTMTDTQLREFVANDESRKGVLKLLD